MCYVENYEYDDYLPYSFNDMLKDGLNDDTYIAAIFDTLNAMGIKDIYVGLDVEYDDDDDSERTFILPCSKRHKSKFINDGDIVISNKAYDLYRRIIDCEPELYFERIINNVEAIQTMINEDIVNKYQNQAIDVYDVPTSIDFTKTQPIKSLSDWHPYLIKHAGVAAGRAVEKRFSDNENYEVKYFSTNYDKSCETKNGVNMVYHIGGMRRAVRFNIEVPEYINKKELSKFLETESIRLIEELINKQEHKGV